MSWEPKKLQNFDIKKNVSGKKEERKKNNIGYRVASNERRLIINVGKTFCCVADVGNYDQMNRPQLCNQSVVIWARF